VRIVSLTGNSCTTRCPVAAAQSISFRRSGNSPVPKPDAERSEKERQGRGVASRSRRSPRAAAVRPRRCALPPPAARSVGSPPSSPHDRVGGERRSEPARTCIRNGSCDIERPSPRGRESAVAVRTIDRHARPVGSGALVRPGRADPKPTVTGSGGRADRGPGRSFPFTVSVRTGLPRPAPRAPPVPRSPPVPPGMLSPSFTRIPTGFPSTKSTTPPRRA